jgi:hypothetical protein
MIAPVRLWSKEIRCVSGSCGRAGKRQDWIKIRSRLFRPRVQVSVAAVRSGSGPDQNFLNLELDFGFGPGNNLNLGLDLRFGRTAVQFGFEPF